MGVGDDRSGAQAGVTVAVIGGAGAMGRRICGELAINGCRVYMNGLNLGDCRNGKQGLEEDLQALILRGLLTKDDLEAVRENVVMQPDLPTAVRDADIVIESVPESIEMKRTVFTQICRHCKPQTILGSNTMSLSISELTSVLPEPFGNNLLGMRFLYPVLLIDEVIFSTGEKTSQSIANRAERFLESIGKIVRHRDDHWRYFRIDPNLYDVYTARGAEKRKTRLGGGADKSPLPAAPKGATSATAATDSVEFFGGAVAYYTDGQGPPPPQPPKQRWSDRLQAPKPAATGWVDPLSGAVTASAPPAEPNAADRRLSTGSSTTHGGVQSPVNSNPSASSTSPLHAMPFRPLGIDDPSAFVETPLLVPSAPPSESHGAQYVDDTPREAALTQAQDSSICCICMDEPKSRALVPCGHYCVCASCAQQLIGTKQPCPMCRRPIENAIPIFSS